jgi:hypothetical protein
MGWKMRNLLRPRSIGVCVAVVAVGLLAGGCDWAQFAGGYGHTGDSAGETTITPANVSTITSRFTTVPASQNEGDFISGESAIVNGVMYVVADDGTLYAYDASGSTNCSGTPTTCAPLWTASLGGGSEPNETMPVVSNGVVYATSSPETGPSAIYAFSAAGTTNCSGTPTVCSPLWTATIQSPADLTLHGTTLYVPSGGALKAFDANGVTDCSGTPKTCSPLWTTGDLGLFGEVTLSSSNVAYVVGGSGNTIYAFEASGTTNCSGGVCSPLRSYDTDNPAGTPVVSGSTLFVDTYQIIVTSGSPGMPAATVAGGLEAFDATGSTNCAGSPAVCTPLWQSSNAYATQGPPAVANGDVYVPTSFGPLAAFSANGSTNCSGSPTVCTPLWTTTTTGWGDPLTVGGSVLYAINGDDGAVYAFDATGVSGCTNAVCSPLWSSGALHAAAVSIANDGTLYVSAANESQQGGILATNGYVDAFALPTG